LKVRENRRGTLKRMPGGVGGTAANTAYPSRLDLMHYPGLKGAEHRNSCFFVAVLCTFISEFGTSCYRRFAALPLVAEPEIA